MAVLVTPAAALAALEPPLQPIEVAATIPVPKDVALETAILAPDAQHVIVAGSIGGKPHVGVMNLDGSDFHCITCGLVPQAQDPDVFDDGRRLIVSGAQQGALGGLVGLAGGSGGLGDMQYTVIECAPSLYDCEHRAALPLDFPIDSIQQGAQNREVAPSPDGRFVKWNEVRTTEGERMTIGRLVRGAGGYTVADPRVLQPGYSLTDDPAGWIAMGRFYESGGGASGRSFWDGGRTLKYGVTTTALNYDIWEVDLATGRRRELTDDLDYNEMSDASPDGSLVAYASPRGLDRMDVVTQLVRPPFLDVVAFPVLGRISLFNNRRCMNERWLMDRHIGQQRGGYAGQPVVTEDGWAIRSWRWFPDSTRALIEEERIPNEKLPSDPRERIRIRILRFPARHPTAPEPTVPIDEHALDGWTQPYGRYHTMAVQQASGRVVRGPAGGTATLDFGGTFAAGSWAVRYDGYSEDGRTFVSGTEQVVTGNPLVATRWMADLTEHGAHTGHLKGSVVLGPQSRYQASVDSEVDGHRFSRIPVQADCPGIHQTALAVERARITPIARGRHRLTGRVTSMVPEDAVARPVVDALVRWGRARGRTDADGVVRLVLGRGRRVPRALSATAAGFRPSAGRARVVR